VTSFNILADAFIEQDNKFLERWYPSIDKKDLKMSNRFDTLIQYIYGDIILLQEVTPWIRRRIYNILHSKYIVLPLSVHKSKTETTGNLTLIKKHIFKTIKYSTFYTNNKAVSITYADNICIYNIHLDDKSKISRYKELKHIISTFEGHKKIIIGGDFNGNEKSLHLLLNNFTLNIKKKGTYLCETPMIDYIYAYGFKSVKGFIDNNIQKNCYINTIKKYGSDHHPIYSTIS
jgi:endonuclease/exonuclease/phosphatase (EEP) superfamily protein YafD